MVNVTSADVITQQAIHDVVQEATEETLPFPEAFRSLDISGIENDTIELPVGGDAMASPERIGENGEFPRDEEDISTEPVTVEKYGVEVSVSRESQQDSVFDVVARQVERKARRMAELWNEKAFQELDANLHPDSPAADSGGTAGVLEFTDVMRGKTILQQDQLDPDLLIVNVKGEEELATEENGYFRMTELGDNVVREGAIGRIAGFDVVLDNSDHMSQTQGEAYLVDTDRYGYEVVKESVMTDEYYDDSRHANIFQIWARFSYFALEPEAAIKIEP